MSKRPVMKNGPRYDLVPQVEPVLKAYPRPPEPTPHGFSPGDITLGKILFAAAVALASGYLIAKVLS